MKASSRLLLGVGILAGLGAAWFLWSDHRADGGETGTAAPGVRVRGKIALSGASPWPYDATRAQVEAALRALGFEDVVIHMNPAQAYAAGFPAEPTRAVQRRWFEARWASSVERLPAGGVFEVLEVVKA